jgi:hypothetical protein
MNVRQLSVTVIGEDLSLTFNGVSPVKSVRHKGARLYKGPCNAHVLNGSLAGLVPGCKGASRLAAGAEPGKFHDVPSPGFFARLRKTRLLDGKLRSECEREDTVDSFHGLCQRLRLIEISGDELHLLIKVGTGGIPGERPDLLSRHQ